MAVVLKVQRPHQLNPEVQIHSPHRPTRWGALGFSPATCLLITLQVTLVQTKCDPLPCSSSPRSSLEADIFLLVFDLPDDCGPCCRTDECACLTFLGTVSPVPGISQLHGCVIRVVTGPHSQSSEFALMLCSSVLTFLILLSLILCFLCEVWWDDGTCLWAEKILSLAVCMGSGGWMQRGDGQLMCCAIDLGAQCPRAFPEQSRALWILRVMRWTGFWLHTTGTGTAGAQAVNFVNKLLQRRRKWQPTSVFLPGKSQGQRSLVGCRLWGRTELDTTEAT